MKELLKNNISNNHPDSIITIAGKRFLTAVQVAKIIAKHPKWLERKRWEGGGPLFRYIGKTPLYEEQDVIDWLNSIPKIMNTSQLGQKLG